MTTIHEHQGTFCFEVEADVSWCDQPQREQDMSNETREGTVGEVIDGRVSVYGDPKETFGRIAQMWSGLLGFEVHDWQVPLAMQAMKMVRTTQAPDYSDNTDDIEGYLDIFRQLIGDKMIHARSVTEYLKLREQRDNPLRRVQPTVDTSSLTPRQLEQLQNQGLLNLPGLDQPLLSSLVREQGLVGHEHQFMGRPRACGICGEPETRSAYDAPSVPEGKDELEVAP